MPGWYWYSCYPTSVVIGGGMGFLLGYVMYALIARYHARIGSKLEFPPAFSTGVRWGIFVGSLCAIAMAVVLPVL